MTKTNKPPQMLVRSLLILASQSLLNFQFIYFWLLGVLLHIAILKAHSVWECLLIAVIDLIVGSCAIAMVVYPIDKAFESVGLNFDKGYGSPKWIIKEKYPLKSEIFRINSAGYTPEDFRPFLPQLASRLKQPIKEIRKPSVYHPVLEVVLKRSEIPSTLYFKDLPLTELRQGEFFIGQSDDGLEKLDLIKMIHMLVAGQTGGGKTFFLKQFLSTILCFTRHSHACLIDMKGGVDFHAFSQLTNFEMATTYESANALLNEVISLFEERTKYLIEKKKTNWSEFSLTDLVNEKRFSHKPIGSLIVMVDELAELTKKATKQNSNDSLQEKISTLARLSRVTGIHLVLGTQRPDKKILDMQSKDNLQTRICFSVPSVAASTLVVGDMSATTLGSHPGRAIFLLGGTKVIQTPLLETSTLEKMIDERRAKQKHSQDERKILQSKKVTPPIPKRAVDVNGLV